MSDKTILKVGNETIPAKFGGSIFHIHAANPNTKISAKAMGLEASGVMLRGVSKAQEYFRQVGLRLLSEHTITYESLPGTEAPLTVHTIDFFILER